jgi:hypothetical protein
MGFRLGDKFSNGELTVEVVSVSDRGWVADLRSNDGQITSTNWQLFVLGKWTRKK